MINRFKNNENSFFDFFQMILNNIVQHTSDEPNFRLEKGYLFIINS